MSTAPVMTSLWAQRSIRHTVAAQRESVARFIASQENGATDEEVSEGLGIPGNSVRPRRGELQKSGRVVYSGKVRKTRAGRWARVYEVRR